MASNSKPSTGMRYQKLTGSNNIMTKYGHPTEVFRPFELDMYETFSLDNHLVVCLENKYVAMLDRNGIVVYDATNINIGAIRKTHKMDETIIFMKWIYPNTLIFITKTSVYHWIIEEQSRPMKMFDRTYSLKHKITGYKTTPKQTWLVLLFSGSYDEDKEVWTDPTTFFTVHSVREKKSFCIRGTAAALTTYAVKPNTNAIHLLVYSKKSTEIAEGSACILHLKENYDDSDTYDITKSYFKEWFPLINNKSSDKLNIRNIEIYAKYGLFYTIDYSSRIVSMYDLETARLIDQLKVPKMVKTWLSEESGEIIGLTDKGQTFSTSVDYYRVIRFMRANPKYYNHRAWILRLATRNNWYGAKDLYIKELNELLQFGSYDDAAVFAASAPKGTLPSLKTMEQLLSAGSLLHYLEVVLNGGPHKTIEEVQEMCKPLSLSMKKCWIKEWMKDDEKIWTRERIEWYSRKALILVLSIYFKDKLSLKDIQRFGDTTGFDNLQKYLRKVDYYLVYVLNAVGIALTSRKDFEKCINAFVQEEFKYGVKKPIFYESADVVHEDPFSDGHTLSYDDLAENDALSDDDDDLVVKDDDIITVTTADTGTMTEKKEDANPEDCEREIIEFEFDTESEHGPDMGFIIL